MITYNIFQTTLLILDHKCSYCDNKIRPRCAENKIVSLKSSWLVVEYLLIYILQSIEDSNQKDWYKSVFKTLHKTDKPKGKKYLTLSLQSYKTHGMKWV